MRTEAVSRPLRFDRAPSALIPLAVLVSLLVPSLASAAPVRQYLLRHPKHHHCRVHYVKRVKHPRIHGKRVRRVYCVRVIPKVVPKPVLPAPATTMPVPIIAAIAPVRSVGLHAHLDPSFVQDSSDPLKVTYLFSASATATTSLATQIESVSAEPILPEGVLDLFSDGSLACSINVGGSTDGGECPVTYSAYGDHAVIAEYLSGSTSATSGSETERIEPPDVTVQNHWTASSASVTILGETATVKVSGNFHGAMELGIADGLGDTCVASVSGSEATCEMHAGGEPEHLTLGYPGGAPAVVIEPVAPGGERQSTQEWPSDSTSLTPSVTSFHATVEWDGWHSESPERSSTGGTGSPPDPVFVATDGRVLLDVRTTGNFSGDSAPSGYVSYTVEGPGESTTTNTLFGLNPEHPGSQDCSEVSNFSGEAEAQCELTFAATGSYTIHTAYHSTDPNYAGRVGPSATVSVG